MFSQHDSEQAVMLEYDGFWSGNNPPRAEDIGIKELDGDGDFKNAECVDILKRADIVVTNPPFSLFREYIAQLIEHDKKFIVIGNQNAISYAEIFPLIKSNQLWLGINPGGRDMYFDIPQNHVQSLKDNYDEGSAYVYVDGQIKRRLGNAAWFTNLEYSDRRDKKLELTKKYKAESYPHYDNYDAIEVSAVSNIPKDYEGMMGVPITFLEKYSPDQFEIVGMDRPLIKELTGRQKRFVLAGRECYARIVIKNKNPEKPGTLN